MAVISGIADETQQEQIVQHVLLNDAVAAVGTPYMKFFEMRALAVCGARQEMLAGIETYWGAMLDAGASSFWEAYDADAESASAKKVEQYEFYNRPFGKSLCHAWSSGPLALLSADYFGLRPLAPAWSEFTCEPAAAGLEWICVDVPTPAGAIHIEQEGTEIRIDVPENMVFVWEHESGPLRYNGAECITLMYADSTGWLMSE
ncbi:MAG: hypothetical protein HRU15_10750 [Planctomycetes bacterium]|nr:hypothetical protein [Planctomycetota bacterium]